MEKHVASMLNGKGADEAPKIIKRLFKEGFVKEAGKDLTYPTLAD